MIKDGIFDWAVQHPGHPDKVYAGSNESQGIVWHSAEGFLPSLLRLVQDINRQASWTGSIAFDGTLYQHYPVTARCWASGNAVANRRYWSFELEGTAGNAISAEQIQTCLRIAHEFEGYSGLPATRKEAGPRTMFEHNEVAQIATPNAGPTSCPSHRYDPFFAVLEGDTSGQGIPGEEPMTPEERSAFIDLAAVVLGAPAEPPANYFAHYAAEAKRVASARAKGHEQLIQSGGTEGIGSGARVRFEGTIEEVTK